MPHLPPAATRPLRRVLAFALAATALGAVPARSQLSGVVRDLEGAPLQGVTVEAWSPERRLAVRVTDAGGFFRFPPETASATTALYAHRLGYRGTRLEVVAGAEVEIRLQPQAIPLPSLNVVADRELCPRNDEPAARVLWDAARRRYAGGLDTMGVATYLASSRAVVSPEALAWTPPQGEALEQRGSSFLLRVSWRRRIEREGYAYPVRRPTAEGSLDSWVYAPLEADLAPHFADPLFGRLHTLFVAAEDPDGWELGFCPRDPRRPSIQGSLLLSGDTALVSARWSFRTPEPREGAGGQAVFPRLGRTSGGYLLPSEGVFWRRTVLDDGVQRTHERYEGWIVAPGDSVPFLPSRKGPASPQSPP